MNQAVQNFDPELEAEHRLLEEAVAAARRDPRPGVPHEQAREDMLREIGRLKQSIARRAGTFRDCFKSRLPGFVSSLRAGLTPGVAIHLSCHAPAKDGLPRPLTRSRNDGETVTTGAFETVS